VLWLVPLTSLENVLTSPAARVGVGPSGAPHVIEALWPHLPPEGGKRNLTCRSLVLIYSQQSGEAHRLSCLPDVTTLVFIDLNEIRESA
jgi:hypothetical protein